MSTTTRHDRSAPAREQRPPLIDLSGDRLGLATAPHVREAAKRALDAGETHYTTRPGLNPLRHAIAEKLERENAIRVHPEREVLVTCGTREALFVALHVLLERGDQVVVAGPAARLYREVARLAGATARVVTGDPADGFAVDPDAIAARLTSRSRALVLVSPSSPAGSVADGARLDALAALAVERGLAVVSVETLEPFVYDGPARSIASLPGMFERTVTINGFSEAYGLAGWRVGYLAGPESLLGPMTQLKQAMSICSPAVSQHAALAAITGPREPLESAHALVGERRDRVFAALAAAGVPHIRPAGGYRVLVDARGLDAAPAALRAARLRLGSVAPDGAPGWLSLALASPSEVLEAAARRLGSVFADAKEGRTDG